MIFVILLLADVAAKKADFDDLRRFIPVCTTSTRGEYQGDLPPAKRELAKIICEAYDKGLEDGAKSARGQEIIPFPAYGMGTIPIRPARKRR